MKKQLTWLFIIALTIFSAACSSDDDDSNANVDELVGDWVSEGVGNVAPGLALTLNTARINATFNENQTYTVVSIDSAGAEVTFEGTWSTGTEAEGSIRSITLNQTVPTSVTSTGIFQVTNDQLRYEVIQTTPAIDGFTAPTVEDGFGSTAFGGAALGITWIQTFTKSTN